MVQIAKNEDELRREFYLSYLPRIDSKLKLEDVLQDNSDGMIKGNLLEFKLHISDLNQTLFQSVKYLSARRIKGKPVPANILLISLDNQIAYLYHSADYLADIEKAYFGGASKENKGFIAQPYYKLFKYSEPSDEEKMIQILRTTEYAKINLDENCIVGWATYYYEQNPSARKADFIGDKGQTHIVGEIRKPTFFKEYINPYKGETNERFRYLMDKLNDFIQKKNLGAFYTHQLYAKKALELVRKAIKRVPKGNDYIIIDRCAGTGNLEIFMTEEELNHTIVSTLEYYEYKVLMEVIGDKVKHIIPPTDREDTFNMGLVRGADALTEEYINHPTIKQYVDEPHYTIILFENPPYAETTSLEHQRTNQSKKSSVWKSSFVVTEMRKEVKGTATNDLGNAFIWSAFKYYLRQPTDSYIVFSPVKYWKAQHLINKKFIEGYAFNRRHFHTNIDACIMCALWSNEETSSQKSISLNAFEIINNKLETQGSLPVYPTYYLYSKKYYGSKEDFKGYTNDGILVGLDGKEAITGKKRIKPLYHKDMIGYLVADSFGFDNPDAKSSLLIAGRYNGNGFYLHRNNYLEKLPMFAASRYITYNREWTERGRIMKSADGADEFFRDIRKGKLEQFLLKCLLFTVLEPQNHMRTFTGSDRRFYVNQLCLDTTNIETIASLDIKKLNENEEEKILLELWDSILREAKNTANYHHELTYGLYQIKVELNTSYKDELTGETRYNYPVLQGNIQSLAKRIKDYYNKEIVPILFKYQLLK